MTYITIQNSSISKKGKKDYYSEFKPKDGFDDNFIGDAEDRENLARMTEEERKRTISDRKKKRKSARRKFIIRKKLRIRAQEEKDNKGRL